MQYRVVILLCAPALLAATTPDPPDPKKLLPKYTIDLDQPPEKRWVKVIEDKKLLLTGLIALVKSTFDKDKIAAMIPAIKKGMDKEFAAEIQGIAGLLNISYDDLLVWNSYYELSEAHNINKRACTSIVAQSDAGSMYAGHNFDYPTYFAPTLIDATFTKAGKVLFEASIVAGGIGPVAGMVPGSWSIAIDARDRFKASVPEAVKAAEAGAYNFVGLVRKALETQASYDEAVQYFKETPLITGGYCIVGGSKPGQGAVVTTNSSAINNDVWNMKDAEGWYIVETNYDHQLPDPEGRRIAAKKNMDAIGSKHITLEGMWNVLSTSPNYRVATVSTHLVDIQAGDFRSYIRHSILDLPSTEVIV